MNKNTHGGKRSNAGRLPNYGEKNQEWKAIYIKVPKEKHAELFKVCKDAINSYICPS